MKPKEVYQVGDPSVVKPITKAKHLEAAKSLFNNFNVLSALTGESPSDLSYGVLDTALNALTPEEKIALGIAYDPDGRRISGCLVSQAIKCYCFASGSVKRAVQALDDRISSDRFGEYFTPEVNGVV